MKIFNKYTYLFFGIILISVIVILNFIPNLETEEFDQEVIDDIIEGVTTTTIISSIDDDLNETPEPLEVVDEVDLTEEQILDLSLIHI